MIRPSEKRFDLVESFDALALAGKKPDPDKRFLDLVDSFDGLAMDNKKPAKKLPILRPGNPFVGGFNHNAPPIRGRASLPAPDAQQSRTMQYALKLPIPNTPGRSTLAPPFAGTSPPSISDSIKSPKVAKVPSTPPSSAVSALTQPTHRAYPGRSRAVSAPFPRTTTSPGKGMVQCSGMTRAGNHCSRQVRLPAMYIHLDPIPVLYCHQHKDASQSGCYIRTAGKPEKFVEFSHYIPKYLQMNTQLALRTEMEKPTATADEPGFIYAFEIRDHKKTEIQLKVGRSVNLNKRFNEWDKQCRSREHIPRGWWPGAVEDDHSGSLLKGNIKVGDPGPFCHRVERLVHIELADLSLHAPYLDPEWPDVNLGPTLVNSPKKSTRENKCPDCGAAHKEIFTFRRLDQGQYKGKEWELIVKPVIEKWGRFVKDYYA